MKRCRSVSSRGKILQDHSEELEFMSQLLSRKSRPIARLMLGVVASTLFLAASSASAQEAMTKESAGGVKAAFLADIEVMRGKFIGLANAFPADKYTWRPMDGVRSVSEVLMLIASEGYGFVPSAVGGKAGLAREEMQGLSK